MNILSVKHFRQFVAFVIQPFIAFTNPSCFLHFADIRTAELVIGRSINLALSARGRKALAEVGLEDALLQHGIPMKGRMLHDLKGNRKIVPYDANTNQCIYSVGRKHLNEVLLDGECGVWFLEKFDRYRLQSSAVLVNGLCY